MNLEEAVVNFCECSSCGKTWTTREAFLEDRQLNLIGYQANFEYYDVGRFLFEHTTERGCSSFYVSVSSFSALHVGLADLEDMNGTSKCPGYCMCEEILKQCPVRCRFAHARELLPVIQNYPKK